MTLLDSSTVLLQEPRPDLEWPILLTLAYGDVFDFPMTVSEVHRYLIGTRASPGRVADELDALNRSGRVESRAGYHFLPGRSRLVKRRRDRAKISGRLWESAYRLEGWPVEA